MGQGQANDEIRAQLTRRQERLRSLSAAFEGSKPGAGRLGAFEDLVEGAEDFLQYQDQVPALRARKTREKQLRVVRWTAGLTAADLLGLAITVFVGATFWGWLVLAVLLLACVLAATVIADSVADSVELYPYGGAFAFGAAAILADLLVAHVLGSMFCVLPLILAGFGLGGFGASSIKAEDLR
jgi:hypothetical protein